MNRNETDNRIKVPKSKKNLLRRRLSLVCIIACSCVGCAVHLIYCYHSEHFNLKILDLFTVQRGTLLQVISSHFHKFPTVRSQRNFLFILRLRNTFFLFHAFTANGERKKYLILFADLLKRKFTEGINWLTNN